MTTEETNKAYKKLSLCKEEPKIGEYFGVITTIAYITPYYSDKSSYGYDINVFDGDQEDDILLFKKIDEETIIEVSTGIPFLLNPDYHEYSYVDAVEKIKYFQQKFLKYKKAGLSIIIIDGYLEVDDEFKLLYSKEMNQELKDKLKDYAKIAHDQFDNAFAEIVNRMRNIASVDNAIYDMEQKCKTKSLIKPNDDQK